MAVDRALLDTGVLVAFLHRDDADHEAAVEAIRARSGVLLTTEPVLTESMHLLGRTRGGTGACLEFFLRDGASSFPPPELRWPAAAPSSTNTGTCRPTSPTPRSSPWPRTPIAGRSSPSTAGTSPCTAGGTDSASRSGHDAARTLDRLNRAEEPTEEQGSIWREVEEPSSLDAALAFAAEEAIPPRGVGVGGLASLAGGDLDEAGLTDWIRSRIRRA